jgi:NADPH-dependent ferric siderophore reductase
VTLRSEELADLGRPGPDQRIKLVFPLPGTGLSTFPRGEDWYGVWRGLPDERRNPIRTYTIRDADRAARRLVVDFAAHGETGPASRWVTHARTGDELLVLGPDASSDVDSGGFEWRPGAARTLLLAGDETATPAICAILESLPADARGAAFLEVPTADDALALRTPVGIEVAWLARDGAGYGDRLEQAVRSWASARATGHAAAEVALDEESEILWDVPTGPDEGLYAWLAGESGAITRLRRYLVGELGIERSRVAFMGYWRLGRAEN